MTDDAIERFQTRPPTPGEEALSKWFDEQELKSADNLEEAARQIITLVSAFVATLFGILGLGADTVIRVLTTPLAAVLAIVSLVALLVALVAALRVVLPGRYDPSRSNLTEKRRAFDALLERKSRSLNAAAISFGAGVAALALLTCVMLVARLRGGG